MPTVAPREYWSWKYQNADGQARIAAWFEAYPYGVRAAEEDGIGHWSHIQLGVAGDAYPPCSTCGDKGPLGPVPPPLVPSEQNGLPPGAIIEGPFEVLPPGRAIEPRDKPAPIFDAPAEQHSPDSTRNSSPIHSPPLKLEASKPALPKPATENFNAKFEAPLTFKKASDPEPAIEREMERTKVEFARPSTEDNSDAEVTRTSFVEVPKLQQPTTLILGTQAVDIHAESKPAPEPAPLNASGFMIRLPPVPSAFAVATDLPKDAK